MVNFIIASHGEFASGIKMSGQMIFGEQENVEVVTFMPNEGPDDLHQKFVDVINHFEDGNNSQILFLVDLWGGSPFNQANLIVSEHPDNMALIAGLNLPMLIEAYSLRFNQNKASEIAKSLVSVARKGVKSIPEAENSVDVGKNVETDANKGLKKGKIKINLARIDTRLLHGQVATAWTPDSKANRIIVVSDNVSKDEMRKNLIIQAAPNGINANVIPVNKMIEIMKDDRMGGVEAFLLFENPQDALRAVEGGVPLTSINIGSMAHSSGKTMVNNVLSMDKNDVQTFEKLRDLGVKFDVRKVPSDSSLDLFNLIKKANIK